MSSDNPIARQRYAGNVLGPKLRSCEQALDEAEDRIADLQAIVDKLPKTADGVPVVPGEYVWTPGCAMWIVCRGNGSSDYSETLAAEPNAYDMDPSMPVRFCYSTREAAEAATSD